VNQPRVAPQTPGAVMAVAQHQSQALEPVDGAQDLAIQSIAGRDDVERIETVVTIPEDYQYAISRKVKDGDTWRTEYKVGLTADAYDYLNRVIGVSFFLPEWVHNEQGEKQRNPIHRKDYIYLRLGAVWYTPLGQLVMATEDVEVDFNLTWMDARINSYGAQVVTNPETGMPLFDDFGNPAVKLDPKDELKALKTLSQLRTFGPRYAQTVARVRLLKMAVGIRSLPIPQPAPFKVKVVGYRDRMTPQERIKQAGGDLAAIYGNPTDIKPLTAAEVAEVAPIEDDTERIDRDLVAAHEGVKPIDAPWTSDELDAIE
jgi:hypothetical protein